MEIDFWKLLTSETIFQGGWITKKNHPDSDSAWSPDSKSI